MRREAFLALLLAASPSGCAAIAGVNDFEPVDCVDCDATTGDANADTVTDADPNADTAADADAAAPDADANADAHANADADANADAHADTITDAAPLSCSPAATASVAIGAWSIDATEVTNAQYAAFLADVGTSTSGQPAYCSWNTSYVPTSAWPAGAAHCDEPVAWVDWCDARAYCTWAKKRLCGSPSGGPTPYAGSAFITASTSQWYSACSVAGIAKYPYGDTWSTAVCVDNSYDGMTGTGPTDVARKVGSAKGCHGVAGEYAAVFDLVGNVREWEDDCDGTKDGSDNCRTRGGGYTEGSDKANCPTALPVRRDTTAANTGFRCCSP